MGTAPKRRMQSMTHTHHHRVCSPDPLGHETEPEHSMQESERSVPGPVRGCAPHDWRCPVIIKLDPDHVAWTCARCGAAPCRYCRISISEVTIDGLTPWLPSQATRQSVGTSKAPRRALDTKVWMHPPTTTRSTRPIACLFGR